MAGKRRFYVSAAVFLLALALGVVLFISGRAQVCWAILVHKMISVDVECNLESEATEVKSPLLQTCSLERNPDSAEFWIAHGGGIGEYVYSNSREAVQDSLSRGFKYIELDLLTTTDGFLIGGHDWKTVRKLAGIENQEDVPLSCSELMAARSTWTQTFLFADDICRLMRENPQMILVTDKIQDFEFLIREIPYADRMVVEAYDCYKYLRALRAGFKNVALTVWSEQGMKQARKYKLKGVVLSATVIETDTAAMKLAEEMHQEGCCFMVHWSSIADKPAFIQRHLGKCISRIYTDTWSPKEPPPCGG